MELKLFVIRHRSYGMRVIISGWDEEDAFKSSGKDPEFWEVVWKNEEK